MKKITIKKTKNIKNLEFVFPQSKGVYLIVGPNGVGKTTLLVCIDRICNKNAFARGFSASRSFGEVDQYAEAEITYDTDNPPTSLKFRKKVAVGQFRLRVIAIFWIILAIRRPYLFERTRIELMYLKKKSGEEILLLLILTLSAI